MGRYVEITKDGNNYTVNPNANGGGSLTGYGWDSNSGGPVWTNFDIPPETVTDEKMLVITDDDSKSLVVRELLYDPVGYGVEYTKISDTSFSLGNEAETIVYTRNNAKDFTLWELS